LKGVEEVVMMNINKLAFKSIYPLLEDPEVYRVGVIEDRTTIIDCGVEHKGSILSGKYYSEASMGGLGEVGFDIKEGVSFLKVEVELPWIATLCSQLSGIVSKNMLISGPGRALIQDDSICKKLCFSEKSEVGVFTVETSYFPKKTFLRELAKRCSLYPEGLYMLISRPSSITGTIQILARVVEAVMYRLYTLNFNVKEVISALGEVPMPAVLNDDEMALCISNSSIIYGGSVHLWVDSDDDDVNRVLKDLHPSSSKQYGKSFYEIFQESKDICKIDPSIFSPSKIRIDNIKTGSSFEIGELRYDLIERWGKS